MRLIAIFLTLLFFHENARAFDFGFQLGAAADSGKGGDTSSGVIERNLFAITLSGWPYLKFGAFQIGPTGSYRIVEQTTDPNSISGSNIRGSQYFAGLGAGFVFSGYSLSASYELFGKYSLTNTSLSGGKVEYLLPAGISARIGIPISSRFSLDLRYSSIVFKEVSFNGASTTLASGLPIVVYGAGVSLWF